MINKKYLKILRSKRNLILNNFIYDEIATRIIDSLDLLKVDFKNILEIGINENKIYNYLNNRFNNLKFTRNDISILNDKKGKPYFKFNIFFIFLSCKLTSINSDPSENRKRLSFISFMLVMFLFLNFLSE